jgi:predicted metal-binding membrane protein
LHRENWTLHISIRKLEVKKIEVIASKSKIRKNSEKEDKVNSGNTFPTKASGNTASRSWWLLMLWPWGLVIVAWSILLLASSSSYLRVLDHDYLLRESHFPWVLALGIFLVSWQLMTAAMMLPSTLLTLPALVPFDHQRKQVWGKQAGFIAAYAMAWVVFALLAFLGDTLIHLLVNRWFWLYTHSWLIGTVTYAVAGVFQLSSLKGRCLKICSNFSSTCLSTFQEGADSAWHLGLRYGQFCVGSCWALMLVMFGSGGRSMIWMAALTGILIAEKGMPRYQHIRYVIGIALFLLAIGMVLYYRSF